MPANSIVKKAVYDGVEYKLLDSIKSTGTQWIDTGMKLRGDYKYQVVCRIDYLGGGYTNPIFGAKEVLSAGKSLELQFHIKTTTTTSQGEVEMWMYYQNIEYVTVPTNLLFWYTRKWTFCLDGSDDEKGNGFVRYSLYPSTPQYPDKEFLKSDFETTYNGYLFACNNNGVAETSGNGELYIYDYQVYDKTGNLLQHLIPVERVSDGKLGMIDTTNSNFLTNQGTGEFVKGDYITLKKIREYTSIEDNIPLYEELECIEQHLDPIPMTIQDVDSLPFFDIDLCPNRNFSSDFSYELDDLRGSSKLNGNAIYHTCNISWTTGGFAFYSYQGATGTFYWDLGSDEKSLSGSYVGWGEPGHKYRVQCNRWEHDGVVETLTECVHKDDDDTAYGVTSKKEPFNSRKSIWVFRAELANKVSTSTANCYGFSGKCYYIKFYKDIDGVDTLVSDLRPVKRLNDNIIGLYDYVRHRFFEPTYVTWQSSVQPSLQTRKFSGTPKETPTYIMGPGKVYPNNERVTKLTNKATNKIITLA